MKVFSVFYTAKGTQVFRPKQHGQKKIVKDLNSLLRDIYEVRDKPLRDELLPKYFKVFQAVSLKLTDLMKQVDPYYERYSGVRFTGRHDQLRINKPDEFDLEIVIGLPVHDDEASNVVIEEVAPGFVELKLEKPIQQDEEEWRIMETAYRWLDSGNHLLQSLFMEWFKSVVEKAVNLFDATEDNLPFAMNVITVEEQTYTLRLLDDSSPCLIVEDLQCGFRLDMDLVPALELLDKKCRKMPSKLSKKINFLVIPKAMQGSNTARSWRLPLKLEEWDLLYMKQAIRLIKKLRDSLGMTQIASYYIRTMFYHEAGEQEHDPDFWSRNVPADLFKHMVKKFSLYLENKDIPYFWNADFNLIGHIDESTLDSYAKKLKRFIHILDDASEYKKVAKYLMSESQFKEYKKKILNI